MYLGVYLDKRGKWFITIRKDKKNYFIGRFDDELKAAIAYNSADAEHHKEFAKLNVI